MKKQLLHFMAACLLMMPLLSRAQNVGINTDNSAPASSAMLDVKSTSKGLLIPRMTTGERTAIAAPANGLMVYDLTTNSFWFYKNTAWTEVTGSITLPYAGTANASSAAAFDVTNASNTAILGYAGGIGHGVAGNASGTGNGVIGQGNTGAGVKGTSMSGRGGSFESNGNEAGVYGSSGNGIGGHFYTSADKPGVYGISENGFGGKFEGNNDSAGVYGISLNGPGGEFKSATGPAVKARGSVDILKSRLRLTGNMANGNAHGIEFSNNAGTAMSSFYGMLNDSVSGFFGNNAWRLNFNNTNGNLGLQNNSNPRAPLSFSSSAGNKIALYGDGDAAHYGIGIGAGTVQLYGPTTGADVVMGYGSSTAFTENMRVKGTGNVGIGTATPTSKLEVAGGVKATGFVTTGGASLTNNLTLPGDASITGSITTQNTVFANAVHTNSLKVSGGNPVPGAVLTATTSAGNATWVNNRIGFNVAAGSPQLPNPTSSTKIPFATTYGFGFDYNDGNAFNNAANQFVAPSDGIYHFDANVVYSAFSGMVAQGTAVGDGIIFLYLMKNANEYHKTAQIRFRNGDVLEGSLHLSGDIKLVAGDAISVVISSYVTSSGVQLYISGDHSSFSGHKVY